MKTNSYSKNLLLLFDIDGTLIRSGGLGRKAITRAMRTEFNVEVETDFKDFAGSTDWRILHTLISRNGIAVGDIEAASQRILERYLIYLREEISGPHNIRVMPGIHRLLDRVSEMPLADIGLLTGNISGGAKLKLESVDLYDRFPVGGFGSDAMNRNELPPIAVARAEAHYRRRYSPDNVWVIGDTPRDIECGKVNGYRTLAVATGGWELAELQAGRPDALLTDLSDTEAVLAIFNGK